ncbi:DEAD/DEAH box helicase [Legionella brunensis]|uniref:SNF2/RAD54 family transporter domain-containing protein n=1 Tax=Legionella brunensis TaxID=29422 RepID=A0A0W0SD72_9GAMM|nr:DEAD/DEAH box helicase [Legionella brunensis]KTC81470.1 SNF2/RAD54 family transporter domain-containing protein [Legionella brunensis]
MLKDALSRMAEVFLPTILMYGQEYQQKGYVLNIRLSDGLLKARVKGGSSQIYDVHIDLKSWPANPAHCSCSYHINCKHAVASLFALQVRENYEIPAPSTENKDQSLDSWLADLREKEEKKITRDNSHEVVYLVEPQFHEYEHRIIVKPAIVKRRKKGGIGKKIFFNSVTNNRRQYFTAEDEKIIATLIEKNNGQLWFDKFSIRNSDLLQQILNTKRVYLAQANEPKLELGETLPAILVWQLASDGKQHAVLQAYDEKICPMFLDKIWYFDKEENVLGFVDVPYNLGQLKKILNTPPIELEQIASIAMQITISNPDMPTPQIYEDKEVQLIEPSIRLIFDAIELTADPQEQTNAEPKMLFVVDVFFDYAGIKVNAADTNDKLMQATGKKLLEIPRNFTFEKEIYHEITQVLSLRSPSVAEKLWSEYDISKEKILTHFHSENDLPRFYKEIIPVLEKKKWQVEFIHPIYKELVEADEVEWFSEIEEQSNDFFSYQLGILVDGKQVSIVPLIADLIGRLDKNKIDDLPNTTRVKMPLPDGKVLQVTLGRIKPLIRFLLQYGTRHAKNEARLQINRYQLILMQETEQATLAISARWLGAETIRQQLQQLTTSTKLPKIPVPQGLNATLRDYQQEGLNWLQFLRASHFGGVLADDMGLGKTVQTLAHLQVEKEQGRLTKASLIVAPTSLVGNWFEEAKRFTPELKLLVFHGASRHQDNFDDYDIVISTYGLIQRDKSRFIDYPFYYLILDESQSIKNARTKTTQIIQQISAKHRLCLSGTPLENHLGELWSLFHFLMPGLLGEAKQFSQFFRKPIEKQYDTERRQLLAKRVQPFILRRTKNQVARELPDKTEMTRTIELIGPQRDLYEAIRMSMEKKVREAISKQGMEKSHIVLLDALLKLRQVCCDPRLLSMPEAEIAYGASAKLDTLMELLESLVDEGRHILIFSQFTSMLKLIEEQLINRNYEYLKLTGQTQNRQALVNTFQQGDIPIFLISLKAGGTGLNLTRADTVIHYDPWWNPAVEDQATDRSHRIGQENPVFVYKLITTGTVEEAILAMQDRKRQLFDGILSDSISGVSGLTTKDIEQFFMPLPTE